MNQVKRNQTYYDILEVSTHAPQHEIHLAYQRAKETYSTNSPALYTMFTKEEARELLNLIEEAFLTLGNQAKRKQYDTKINKQFESEQTDSELPDFVGETSLSPIPMKQDEKIPDGFCKTQFGSYKRDDDFENKIRQQKDFSGPFLQKIRDYKKIDVVDLASVTRISKSYIRALESEDYRALPANVFVRGFVVQIAKALDLNENIVSKSYMERLKKASLEE